MIIDGKASAKALNEVTRQSVQALFRAFDIKPALAVVLVGTDAASEVYVRNKILQAEQAGMLSIEHRLPATTSAAELLKLIATLNDEPLVNGILVQLPLPAHIDEKCVIDAIDAHKDVDGFHIENAGGLMVGTGQALMPCTPQGCVMLAKQVLGSDLSGKHAVIVGRSNIVGKPLAIMLLQEHCTVSVVHSRSKDGAAIARQADILMVAVGRAKLVDAHWVKPGATVIDVGINRVEVAPGTFRLQGDVDFDSVLPVAGHITPVPGGVGPMTIACLLRNTLIAACNQAGLDVAQWAPVALRSEGATVC